MSTAHILLFLIASLQVQKLNLDDYIWKNRVIIIQYVDDGKEQFIGQIDELNSHWEGVEERDLVVLVDAKSVYRYLPDQKSGKSSVGNLEFSGRNRFKDFQFTLIGKDGGIKLQEKDKVTCERLFAIIDAMPMRKKEMLDRSMNH